jgi:pyridoxamine 5'-phosphate oxidase
MSVLPQSLLAVLTAPSMLTEALPADPMPIFKAWLDEQTAAARQPSPNAMCLSTIGLSGMPRGRIVLCRGVDVKSGFVVFYTNYEGDKGREMAANPVASVTFHWDHADRQVRIEGRVVKSPAAESDAYFRTRPWESRLSAWASQQSRPMANREQLLNQYGDVVRKLGLDPAVLAERGESVEILRPPHWGGYRIWAERVELWVGGVGRMHDRAAWNRELTPAAEGFSAGPWAATRLQP